MTLKELAYITQSQVKYHRTVSGLWYYELSCTRLDSGDPAIAYGKSRAQAKKNLLKLLRGKILIKHYVGDIGRWEFPVPKTLAA